MVSGGVETEQTARREEKWANNGSPEWKYLRFSVSDYPMA